MKIAYLCERYPDPGRWLIRREIRAVQQRIATRAGRSGARAHPETNVLRLSLEYVPAEDLVDAEDREEAQRTLALDAVGVGSLVAAAVGRSLLHPIRWVRAKLRLVALLGTVGAFAALPRAIRLMLRAAWLTGELRRQGIEHVHVHRAGEAAMVAALVRALGGPPFSISVHGPEVFAQDLPEGKAPWLPQLMRFAAFTVAMTEHHHRRLVEAVHPRDARGPQRIHLLRCGVEDEQLNAPLTPVPAEPHALFLGRLTADHDPLTLLNAVSRLMSTTDLRLLDKVRTARVMIMGEGELEERVTSSITHYKVQDWTYTRGWADTAQTRAEIESARVVVVPSLSHGPPMEVLEAFAAGRPVIATAVDGLGELVRGDGPMRNGWLVKPADPHMLMAALREALTAPVEALEKMAANGREALEAEYRIDEVAGRLLPLFARSERIEAQRDAANLVAQSRRHAAPGPPKTG